MNETVFVKRNLPHFYPAGADFFLTYRLKGSISLKEIENLREEKLMLIQSPKFDRYRFLQYEQILDTDLNEPYWLRENEIARIVAHSWHFLHEKKIILDSYCIMPNHVHVLLSHIASAPLLPWILRDHKGYTANQCNRILNRKGAFWESESYDHVVRNKEEFLRIRQYILNNPVKAGFVTRWEDWKWNYCRMVAGTHSD